MLLNMLRNRAKMGQKEREKGNENLRGQIYYILAILKSDEDIGSS